MFDIYAVFCYIDCMSKFYLISLNNEADNRLETLIKDSFNYWMHYMKCTWIVVSDKGVKEITDLLVPWITRSNDNQLLLVTEINPENLNGWLPQGAWLWLSKHRLKITYQEMENPSLIDMFNCGIFSPEFDRARSIADIDNILKPYEGSTSWFALNAVRNRMIERLIQKIRKQFV